MAWGEGADWEINPGDVGSGTASFLLKVSSTAKPAEIQGDIVWMDLTTEDTPATAAMKLAEAWNTQKHLEEIAAKAEEGGHVTLFLLTGDLASWTITEMGIRFPGDLYAPMEFNQAVEWHHGQLQVTRVLI
jgi:hypothetical protein